MSGGLPSLGSFAQSEPGRIEVVGVEQWAEVRRLHFVRKLSIHEIHRRTGLHRETIRRALRSDEPPRYRRAQAGFEAGCVQGRDPPLAWRGPADALGALRSRPMRPPTGLPGPRLLP